MAEHFLKGTALEMHALLFVAAIVAGSINAVAGGGGLLTFPLLMAVASPVTADATSAVALLPGYATSTWVCRKQLTPVRRWFWLLLGPSVLGGLAGALLLNWSGNRSFTALIPWLVLLATLLILVRPLLTRRKGSHEASQIPALEASAMPNAKTQIAAGLLLFLVAIYGGYFGAGIGILVIGALDMIGMTDIRSILALKNALTGALRAMAVMVFIFEGNIDWSYGIVMATGALIGGYLGGSMVRWTNRTWVRRGVIGLGFCMAAYYFWKIYGSEIAIVGGD